MPHGDVVGHCPFKLRFITSNTHGVKMSFTDLNHLRNLGEVITWFAAAAFFSYKVITGYLIGNCSLRLSCSRTAVPNTAGMDYLAIVAILKRCSGTMTLGLHEAKARVNCASGQAHPDWRELPLTNYLPATVGMESKLVGIERLSSRRSNQIFHAAFQKSAENSILNFAPGDEMQFATLYEVPEHCACIVQVVVLGRSWGTWKRSQWRASDISLPQRPQSD
jgi:hypothetical protein